MRLSPQQVDSFEREGYLFFPELFSRQAFIRFQP